MKVPNKLKEINGDDVILRLIQPEDASRFMEIFRADPEIQKSVTWTSGLDSEEKIREKIQGFKDSKSLRYSIIKEERIVGYIGLWKYQGYFGNAPEPGEYGIGYLCDLNARGQGVIKQAITALKTRAESILPIEFYSLYIHDDNIASQKIVESLGGYRTEEVFEEPALECFERRWILN